METKKCCTCFRILSLDYFGNYKKSKDGKQSRCKECKRLYDNSYYKTNMTGRREKIRKSNEQRRTDRITHILQYLNSHPCVDCGESSLVVLEFDHVRGKKYNNISNLVMQQAPWKVIDDEIAKCEVRCANCHRKITAKRGNWEKAMLSATLD